MTSFINKSKDTFQTLITYSQLNLISYKIQKILLKLKIIF